MSDTSAVTSDNPSGPVTSAPASDPKAPVATSTPANPDTPTPTTTTEGDPSLTRLEQAPHPFADPVQNPEAAPKADAGDVGAAVGERPDLDAIQAHVGRALSVPDGYVGYNPDPRSNDEYTVNGVLGRGATVQPEDVGATPVGDTF